jgi:hypothetical protein
MEAPTEVEILQVEDWAGRRSGRPDALPPTCLLPELLRFRAMRLRERLQLLGLLTILLRDDATVFLHALPCGAGRAVAGGHLVVAGRFFLRRLRLLAVFRRESFVILSAGMQFSPGMGSEFSPPSL